MIVENALVEQIASSALRAGIQIGVAESMTGGLLSSRLAGGPNAVDWFRGGIVAYSPEIKFDLLEVERGPVNSTECARQMAFGAVRALSVEIAAAVTGVGGPGPDDGVPAGTVFLACADWSGQVVCREAKFEGPPSVVVENAVRSSLELVAASLVESTRLAMWRDCHHQGR